MIHSIGITDANRIAVAKELANLLSDEYVLFTKTKNAHWNIEGTDFYEKHKFFETQFEQLHQIIDDVAERIRTLGHYNSATLKNFLELTHLTEVREGTNDSKSFIEDLLIDHESIIIHCRENALRFANEFKDSGTSDFVTSLLKNHEKMAWLLRAHLN
jgi:starvation-inducible DNA-binding protein